LLISRYSGRQKSSFISASGPSGKNAACGGKAPLYRTGCRKREPWLVARKRGDLRRKTFVAKLSNATHFSFKKTLPNTIANVTNVVFTAQNVYLTPYQRPESLVTGETVREMLRRKHRTDSPKLLTSNKAIVGSAKEVTVCRV
jgi:hypothetical protein